MTMELSMCRMCCCLRGVLLSKFSPFFPTNKLDTPPKKKLNKVEGRQCSGRKARIGIADSMSSTSVETR